MRRAAVLLAMLAGCATVKPPPDENVLVSGMIEATLATLRAAAERQRQDLQRAQEAYVRQPDRMNGLQFALLLANLAPPLRDDELALSVLRPLAAQTSPPAPVANMALLLSWQIRARQREAQDGAEAARHEEEARRASEEREQELRRRLDALRALEGRESALLRRQADALRASEQREEMLRRQIEGLRASERGLIEREEKLGGKPK